MEEPQKTKSSTLRFSCNTKEQTLKDLKRTLRAGKRKLQYMAQKIKPEIKLQDIDIDVYIDVYIDDEQEEEFTFCTMIVYDNPLYLKELEDYKKYHKELELKLKEQEKKARLDAISEQARKQDKDDRRAFRIAQRSAAILTNETMSKDAKLDALKVLFAK